MTSSPSFVGTPKCWTAAIGSGLTVGNWQVFRDATNNGAGASGSKITSITATSTDATARVVSVGIGRAFGQTAGAPAYTGTFAVTMANPLQ